MFHTAQAQKKRQVGKEQACWNPKAITHTGFLLRAAG